MESLKAAITLMRKKRWIVAVILIAFVTLLAFGIWRESYVNCQYTLALAKKSPSFKDIVSGASADSLLFSRMQNDGMDERLFYHRSVALRLMGSYFRFHTNSKVNDHVNSIAKPIGNIKYEGQLKDLEAIYSKEAVYNCSLDQEFFNLPSFSFLNFKENSVRLNTPREFISFLDKSNQQLAESLKRQSAAIVSLRRELQSDMDKICRNRQILRSANAEYDSFIWKCNNLPSQAYNSDCSQYSADRFAAKIREFNQFLASNQSDFSEKWGQSMYSSIRCY